MGKLATKEVTSELKDREGAERSKRAFLGQGAASAKALGLVLGVLVVSGSCYHMAITMAWAASP